MVKMRIPIREQLGLLVLFSSLIGLAVIAIATWITTHNFVLSIRASRLSLTASLKASQLASNLYVMSSSVRAATSRIVIQSSLQRYNNGNDSDSNWVKAQTDLAAVFEGSQQTTLLLQAQVFPINSTGLAGNNSVLKATGTSVAGIIELPLTYPNGSRAYLGDSGDLGYPSILYPDIDRFSVPYNSTYRKNIATYDGRTLDQNNYLLIGPWEINETFSLLSLTMPIINNTSSIDILGWLTVVMDSVLLRQVVQAAEGLDDTGVTMLIGPNNVTNHFPDGVLYTDNDGHPPAEESVRFLLPPTNRTASVNKRHSKHLYGTANDPFPYEQYAAVKSGFTRKSTGPNNNAGSMISTKNEQGYEVAVGYALVNSSLCDWMVLVEQAHSEVWKPINHLRTIIIACVFGTAGGLLLLIFPLAHYSSRPIRQLRDATLRSVRPPGYYSEDESLGTPPNGGDDPALARKEGFFESLTTRLRGQRPTKAERREEARRRQFRIPGKVKDRKHFIQDELTDLTQTFNEMTDELMMQYEKLEERVAQRTAELELSKKAAEAANESKTLFIANISHELKTPLNGILGMCAVCMSEDDPIRLKRSLGIIYKSGDLLNNLLTDLLTFSKNQVGQQLSLDEKEFRIGDVSSQVLAIFDKQAKDSGIHLKVRFEGPAEANLDEAGQLKDRRDMGPFGTGRVKDMVMWGDQHRILQVVINLVSNSLKFTPSGGSICITIRCIGDADIAKSRVNSTGSRQTSARNSLRNRSRIGSESESSVITNKKFDTANEINAYDKTGAFAHVMANERTMSPPPGRMLQFEFEVEDTGPGIPDNLQQKIFEPFVQGDLGLTKKYGGTGLGLSICSQLAGLMKGNISLVSEVGKGSVFTLQIPLKLLATRADSTASSSQISLAAGGGSVRTSFSFDEPSKTSNRTTDDARSVASANNANNPTAAVSFESDSKPRLVGLSTPFFASSTPMESPNSQQAAMERVERVATEATKRGDKVRVLVAEDNKTNQEVVLRMLKLEEIYDVTVAKDGQEALDKVRESMEKNNPYNLIFMDVQMPNLDGLQSTRLIRQSGFTSPIVALTAYAEESNVKECMESGMDFFLSKPIRRPQLKQVLKTYCPTIPEESEPSATTTPPKGKKKSVRPQPPPPPPPKQSATSSNPPPSAAAAAVPPAVARTGTPDNRDYSPAISPLTFDPKT